MFEGLEIFNRMYVHCANHYCKHNLEGYCQKDEIKIEIGYGRVSICKEDVLNVCASYEEQGKDEEE